MKKFFILTLLLFQLIYISAQNISVNTKYINYNNFENKNIDVVFINQIDNQTELKVTPSAGVSIKWFKYNQNGLGAEISNQDFISPENNTGYLLEYNGLKKYIWVYDYQQVKPVIENLIPDPASVSPCKNLNLILKSSGYEISYFSVNGLKYIFPFRYMVQYKSLQWMSDSKSFADKDEQTDWFSVKSSQHSIEITNPPLKDTYFVLKGDQVAADLYLDQTAFTSTEYNAVKTEAHMFYETAVRTEKNEADRPENATVLSGSAPLEMTFTGYANLPIASNINWQIWRESEMLLNRNAEGQSYSFKEAGSYVVRFTASNSSCSAVDSVIVKVSESAIYAPNVFTPNGDGVNDEFRVAYKSIIRFKAVIFNRWGRKVFSWTDPSKGWDGKIGSQPAATGAYFYIIEAEGSDKKIHKLKGDINLLRGNTK